MHSMTAYSQASTDSPIGELTCEIRSVNHRYLELAPRMPEELRPLEGAMKEIIGASVTRGRLDIFIRLGERARQQNELNADVLMDLKALVEQARTHLSEVSPLSMNDVLNWPGVMQRAEVDQDELASAFKRLIADAVRSLVEARKREGQRVSALLLDRLAEIALIARQVRAFLPDLAEQQRSRLEEKLSEIADLDPQRVEQEMVLLLNKSDVAEELDRLEVHLEEVGEVLKKGEPGGRRLDFLLQELNREANTLGSKSNDLKLTKASVDIKVLLEQIREQVQNLE